MQREGKKIQPLLNRDLLAGCGEVDYIITSVLCHVWVSCIAEKLGKKWGLITFSPPTTPTKEFPFAGVAFFNNPFYNMLSHRLVQGMYWRFNKNDINEFRASISLPPLKNNILNRITDESFFVFTVNKTTIVSDKFKLKRSFLIIAS